MPEPIQRYRDRVRINHWLVALMFLCAGMTGLAILHPAFFFFTALFGGGAWSRVLHPYFGVLMAVGFLLMFVQLWRDNRWERKDTVWLKAMPRLLKGDEEGMPPIGKYNAGQKMVFWLFGICLLLLIVTGILFWRPWFAPFVPIPVRRVAVLIHAVTGSLLIIGVIVHIHAAIWVKGSMQAMTRGWVSPNWARRHHPLWYRQLGDKHRGAK